MMLRERWDVRFGSEADLAIPPAWLYRGAVTSERLIAPRLRVASGHFDEQLREALGLLDIREVPAIREMDDFGLRNAVAQGQGIGATMRVILFAPDHGAWHGDTR